MTATPTIFLTPEGHPFIEIDPFDLWDLVDFLSQQRVHVSCHFEETHFKVIFTHQTAPSVAQLLHDWLSHAHSCHA